MGGFYGIFPHNLLVGLFAPVFLFAVLALGLGVRRFWRDVTPATSGAPLSAPATAEATDAVLRLKYLDGGHGDGCHNEDDAYTLSRRRMHHLTFYGFMLCFAATSGLALWAARGTAGLPLLLCLQLGAVMALFATMPYGKFAHGIFRTASLLRHAVEKRQPNPIGLSAD